MTRKNKVNEIERSDDFYETLASTRPGPLGSWAEPLTPTRPHVASADNKLTAIFTIILALLVTAALAVWFMQGIATIKDTVPQTSSAQAGQ